ncbi:MAG: type II toxin-antitoxin system RelE/ParE family toxin [Rhodobacteraceae bacterium]|nr:type II toxin-antitoxin system RelE/ParE family toxin [Paracoccaceae bacterium]
MDWEVGFHDAFEWEFDCLSESVQDSIFARVKLLAMFGPDLKRPCADTLKGSRRATMIEPRCDADGGLWRIAFAFDPKRKAMLPAAGD